MKLASARLIALAELGVGARLLQAERAEVGVAAARVAAQRQGAIAGDDAEDLRRRRRRADADHECRGGNADGRLARIIVIALSLPVEGFSSRRCPSRICGWVSASRSAWRSSRQFRME